MAKQELKTKQTNVTTFDAKGHQVEQTITVDDSFLPSPNELREYKEINPEIVKLLIDASKNEQQHRHYIDKQKMKAINKDSNSMHTVNILGMTFAFLIIAGGLALSAYLIYLDKDVIGTIFAGSTIVIAAATFLNHVKKSSL